MTSPLLNRYTCALALMLGLLAGFRSLAQTTNTPPGCGASYLLNNIAPAQREAFEQNLRNVALARSTTSTPDTQQYVLPVAFHIVHQNGPENISDTQVQDALQRINEAFSNQGAFNLGAGFDIDISFCLGNNAITRHVSPLTNMTMENDDVPIKQISPWDPTSYINIWVVNSITSLGQGPGVAGYAMFPSAHGSPIDGIIIEAAFINNNPNDVKVLVHELGHYLGLYHTFEGGCQNNDCTIDGDRICDTPPDNSVAPVSCSGTVNSCHTDADDASVNNPFRATSLGGSGDQPDMFQNYMDYGFQTCQDRFTNGQRTRMRNALRDSRISLTQHPNLCVQCNNPIVASMNLPATWPAGTPVTFSITTAQTGLQILWQFNGQATLSPSVTTTFSVGGVVPVWALIFNPASSGCNLSLRDTITIGCPVPQPTFTVSPPGLVSPGDVITLTAPNNGYTYTWNLDGQGMGSGNTFSYTVVSTEGYLLSVTASNGTCTATSEPYLVDPSNCTQSKENNTWYFGSSAGINFNTSPPQAIIGGISTEEGCSVLCDANGHAVYHSDGVTVANSSTGATLLNGTGLTGHMSTTQSALFIPMPGSSQYVYLITLDYQAGEASTFGGGIFYSLIDKYGDSGNGEVILKNQLLAAPLVEKMTAVRSRAGNGIWLVAHEWNSNRFFAWEITNSGVSIPVISSTGVLHSSNGAPTVGAAALGELKASPSGKKLALAIQGQSLCEAYDFDNATGLVTNPVRLQNNLINQNYGIAFSPNERYLYCSTIGNYKVVRFNLLAGNAAAVNTSCEVVADGAPVGSGGALQLAPDGKIYAARRDSRYLGVIANPNAPTAAGCMQVTDGFRLADYTRSYYGLPNPVQSTLRSTVPTIIGPDKVCLSPAPQTIRYHFDPVGRATYTWTHKGSNVYTAVNDSTADMSFSVAGSDTLIVKRSTSCGISYDTLVIRSGFAPPFDIGPDKLVCRGTSVTLDAGPGMVDYQWSNGGFLQTTQVSTSGKIKITAFTSWGCVLKDSLLINNYTLPALQLGRDTSICTTETITLQAPAGMNSYLWSTGATGSSITTTDSGSYYVEVSKYGCLFSDSIHIRKNMALNILSKDTVVVCLTDPSTYTAPGGYDSYSWKLPSGSTLASQTVTFTTQGYYVLQYTNRCGTAKDSIFNFIPKIVAQDTLVSCADTLRIISPYELLGFVAPNGYWNSYTMHGDTVDVHRTGRYFILFEYPEPQSGCYIRQYVNVMVDTALVRPALDVNLGPDQSYCEGKVSVLNAGTGYDWYHWNTGSTDSSITAYQFGQYSVNAHYCGFDYRDTIRITNDHSLVINLGADKHKCPADPLTLDAGPGYDWYDWNNGQQTQQINAAGTGTYSVRVGLNGCVARDTVTVSNAITNFTITGNPVICAGQTLTLTASSQPGVSYLWDSLNVQTGYHNNTLPITQPGSYTVKNGLCPSSAWSAPFVVAQEILAMPSFSFSPDSVCAGDSIRISFNSAPFQAHHWQDGINASSRRFISSAHPVLTVSGANCSETHAVTIPVRSASACAATGINDLATCDPHFFISPNPGSDRVTLGSSCPYNGALHILLYNTDGKTIGSCEGKINAVNDYLNTLMQTLSPSMYTLSIETSKERIYLKWIIIK